jgi:hypothetical protein
MKNFSVSDAALLAGFAGLTYGLWLAWRPAAFIVGGILLIAFGIVNERGRAAANAIAARRRAE